MANKKNTNKSDVKKDSLKNTSNTSNKSNSKGNTMKKVIKVTKKMSVTEKGSKLIEKREQNGCVMNYGRHNKTELAKIKVDTIVASNGKEYKYIINTNSTYDAFIIDIGNTGLTGQGKETVFAISRNTSIGAVIRCESINLKAKKKNADKNRNGKTFDQYLSFVLASEKTTKNRETGEKMTVSRYASLDYAKKTDLYIHNTVLAKVNSWVKVHNMAVAKKRAEKVSA